MRGSLTFAAAALVALLLALSTPASANGPFPIDVVDGTFTTAVGIFDLGPEDTPPCEPKPTTLAMTFDGNAASGTWTISGTKSRQLRRNFDPTAWLQADITYLTGSGGAYTAVGSPPPTNTLTGTIGIRIDIHIIGTEGQPGFPNCVKSLACRIFGVFTITDGDFVGNPLPNPMPGDDLALSSTSNPLVTQSCMPPLNALGGTIATLDQLIEFQ